VTKKKKSSPAKPARRASRPSAALSVVRAEAARKAAEADRAEAAKAEAEKGREAANKPHPEPTPSPMGWGAKSGIGAAAVVVVLLVLVVTLLLRQSPGAGTDDSVVAKAIAQFHKERGAGTPVQANRPTADEQLASEERIADMTAAKVAAAAPKFIAVPEQIGRKEEAKPTAPPGLTFEQQAAMLSRVVAAMPQPNPPAMPAVIVQPAAPVNVTQTVIVGGNSAEERCCPPGVVPYTAPPRDVAKPDLVRWHGRDGRVEILPRDEAERRGAHKLTGGTESTRVLPATPVVITGPPRSAAPICPCWNCQHGQPHAMPAPQGGHRRPQQRPQGGGNTTVHGPQINVGDFAPAIHSLFGGGGKAKSHPRQQQQNRQRPRGFNPRMRW